LDNSSNNTTATISTTEQNKSKKQNLIVRAWNWIFGDDVKEIEGGTGFGSNPYPDIFDPGTDINKSLQEGKAKTQEIVNGLDYVL
jgi:PKD repeat protein